MNKKKIQTTLTYPLRKYSTCMFAVTNRCNARCGFCSIPMQAHNGATPADRVEIAITRLFDLGVRYIQFTGGEPLLYPYLMRVMKYASEMGFLITLVTNGSLLDDKRARAIAESGVQGVSISVDHHDSALLEENRGIPGLGERIAKGVGYLKENHLPVQASATISKLLDKEKDDYRILVEHNQELGFDGTYFCYPIESTRSNYALGGDIVRFDKEQLAEIISHLQSLKRAGYPIDNSYETLEVVQSFLRAAPSRFPCVAGYKVFYVDWNLNLYDCMTKGNLIGSLDKIENKKLNLRRAECEQCILSCDREPSIYQQGVRSIVPFLRLVCQTMSRNAPF